LALGRAGSDLQELANLFVGVALDFEKHDHLAIAGRQSFEGLLPIEAMEGGRKMEVVEGLALNGIETLVRWLPEALMGTIHGNAPQPGTKTRPPMEPREGATGPWPGLLQKVLSRSFSTTLEPQEKAIERRGMEAVQPTKSRLVSGGEKLPYQLKVESVVHFHPSVASTPIVTEIALRVAWAF